ncbi:unnamed protein product [Orchesella dallaii]|uniref:Uncharacterized protein n=1 Tax=Orchesella dallaii TaxID=48710 RepID=A0ABP1QH61_9HEXA
MFARVKLDLGLIAADQLIAFAQFICYNQIEIEKNIFTLMGSIKEVAEVIQCKTETESVILKGGEDEIKQEPLTGCENGDSAKKPLFVLNPHASEFNSSYLVSNPGSGNEVSYGEEESKSTFAFNPKASLFISSNFGRSSDHEAQGEEDEEAFHNQAGKGPCLLFNPDASEYIPSYLVSSSENPTICGNDGEVNYITLSCDDNRKFYNPQASEFMPSYLDPYLDSSEDHHPVYPDSQCEFYPTYSDCGQNTFPNYLQSDPYATATHSVYSENYQNTMHRMNPENDQYLIHPDGSENEHLYSMSYPEQEPEFTQEHISYDNALPNVFTNNLLKKYNPDISRRLSPLQQLQEQESVLWKTDSLPALPQQTLMEPLTHFSGPITYLPQPPPPPSHVSSMVDNMPISFSPIYSLIGVKPRSHASTASSSRTFRATRHPKCPRNVKFYVGNQYYRQAAPISMETFQVAEREPLHVPEVQPQENLFFYQKLQKPLLHGQHYPTGTQSPSFSSPVKVVIPNVPGNAQSPNGYPSLIPCILPGNYPWTFPTTQASN